MIKEKCWNFRYRNGEREECKNEKEDKKICEIIEEEEKECSSMLREWRHARK